MFQFFHFIRPKTQHTKEQIKRTIEDNTSVLDILETIDSGIIAKHPIKKRYIADKKYFTSTPFYIPANSTHS